LPSGSAAGRGRGTASPSGSAARRARWRPGGSGGSACSSWGIGWRSRGMSIFGNWAWRWPTSTSVAVSAFADGADFKHTRKESIMKLSLGDKAQRVLRFLMGLRADRVAAPLAPYGFTKATNDEGWKLLQALGRNRGALSIAS